MTREELLIQNDEIDKKFPDAENVWRTSGNAMDVMRKQKQRNLLEIEAIDAGEVLPDTKVELAIAIEAVDSLLVVKLGEGKIVAMESIEIPIGIAVEEMPK
jgi:hypothetical protein